MLREWFHRSRRAGSARRGNRSPRLFPQLRRAWPIEKLEERLTLTVIVTGSGSGNTTPPTDDPGFANVGWRNSGSAIYLGNGWVLTANHVGAGDTLFGGVGYTMVPGSAVQLVNPPGVSWTTYTDLLMYRINGAPNLPSLLINDRPPAIGWTVTMIGAGRDRQASMAYWSSTWAPTLPPSTYSGYIWSSTRSVRWGTNVVDAVGVLQGIQSNSEIAFGTTFSETGGTYYEAQGAVGDSGGAVFHKDTVTGQWTLAGLMFGVTTLPGQPWGVSIFGNKTYSADLSIYRDQIESAMTVNHAPEGADAVVGTLPNTAYTFVKANFGFSDPGDPQADAFLGVKITTLPTAGSLTDNGVPVVAGQFIALSDVTTGKLKFTPSANTTGTPYASFTFQVRDGGGTANGGVDLDPTPNTMTMSVSGPVAGVVGPTSVVRGRPQTFTVSATDPSPVNQAAGFTFSIDWGDGSPIESLTSNSGLQVAHSFVATGAVTVRVTATNVESVTSPEAAQGVRVNTVMLLANEDDSSLFDLVWGGSSGDDSVAFDELNSSTIRLRELAINGVTVNSTQTFSGVTAGVIADGNSGNDQLDARGLFTTGATLDGGGGNNTLYGGAAGDTLIGGSNGGEGQQGNNVIIAGNGSNTIYGNDVTGAEGATGGNNLIVGGSGSDLIYGAFGSVLKKDGTISNGGEGGRNLIIGGGGADTIYASQFTDGAEGGHGSILVSGTTLLNQTALLSVLSEWTSERPFEERVANISGTGSGTRNNGNYFLQAGITVFNDGSDDQLDSDTNGLENWLLLTLTQDVANRVKSGDWLTNVTQNGG